MIVPFYLKGQNTELLKYTPPDSINEQIKIYLNTNETRDTVNENIEFVWGPDYSDTDICFPGGQKAYYQFISKNVEYPESSLKAGIEGTVYVGFTINRNGEISDIRIAKGLNSEIDNEVLRVFSLMPSWKWNKNIKEKERMKFRKTISLKFSIEKKKETPK